MRLLFTDLDGLKRVNDRLGHEAGDSFIKEAARVLRTVCRDSDIVARLGGDEFVILATHCETADHLLDRLDIAVAAENAKPARSYELSFSTGIAVYDPAQPTSLEELIKIADMRMYEQKVARRRNRSLPAAARESVGRLPAATPFRMLEGPQNDAVRSSEPDATSADAPAA